MKIVCTKEEKEMLIPAIANSIRCLLHGKTGKEEICERMTTCTECAEQNIEWEIEDGENQES